MRKILITGGAGFIGSSLADSLVQNPDNYVVLVDNLLTGSLQKLPDAKFENWKFIKCNANDYPDISAIMFSHNFDYVFHYAAVVGVQRTLNNPTQVLEDIQGIKNILHLSKNTGVKRVFYASSSEVYGESVRFPQDEFITPLNSRLPYAVVKNVGEAFCTSYQREYGLDYTILRFFNTYGPKQSIDFVISKFLMAAMHHQPVTIYGDGLQSRTFCYIEDNLEAVLQAFYKHQFVNEVVNIGNDVETTILELAQLIIEACGSRSEILHLPPLKEGDMSRRQPNLARMRQLLNRPHTPLNEGLAKIIESSVFHKLHPVAFAGIKHFH
ncbi:epimerase [Sphingobacteriales bacterium UPWRP_1]|nr:epimerase [Sphingobacteriales bacterium TSM_CSS]PSJ79029.1 epimerase [Sphingobacteriales bacterium UPWRP_1]